MDHHQPEFHYCPVCGGQLETAVLKEIEPPRLVCSRCGFVFYLDPKVVACAVVERGDRIVLLKRAIEPQRGRWVIPGGFVDRCEPVASAAVRETMEECGLRVSIRNLLGVYSYSGQMSVVIVYVAIHLDGDLLAGDETQEAAWFTPERIPWKDLAFRSTFDALTDYCARRKSTSE